MVRNPCAVIGHPRDWQQLVDAARGQDEPVIVEVICLACRAVPANNLLPGIDVVHGAKHDPDLAQRAGQRDTDMPRLDQAARHLGHQRDVQEVISGVDQHDLSRGTNEPRQLQRRIEAGETRPDDHNTARILVADLYIRHKNLQFGKPTNCLMTSSCLTSRPGWGFYAAIAPVGPLVRTLVSRALVGGPGKAFGTPGYDQGVAQARSVELGLDNHPSRRRPPAWEPRSSTRQSLGASGTAMQSQR